MVLEPRKKVFFENLDGLRFFCFLSVFCYHSLHTELDYIKQSSIYQFVKFDLFGNGNLGVNFFFVLSGFLITFLLIEEKKLNGQISLKSFWIRRVLRIWPLFFFCVFFGFTVFPIFKSLLGQTTNETATLGYYMSFLNNFDTISKGLPDSSVLGVLWSVAIEEQFYLVWPIILYLLPVRKYWIAFAIVIVSSILFRAANDSYVLHEMHSLSCIGDMAMGATGAWLISVNSNFKERIVNAKRSHILFVYLLLALIFLFRDEVLFSSYGIRIFERCFISIVMLFVILEQSYSTNSLFKLSRFRMISRLGIITYGLYCLHFIGILVAHQIANRLGLNTGFWQVFFIETGLALILAVIIAKLSYRFYERPFLKLKERFTLLPNGPENSDDEKALVVVPVIISKKG